ncbi:hypothetical protein SAMN05444007_102141 [Cribrihabitans marinus]|uniref:O-Antigen ligase n=1 Tax=Cribrihabitans marinus TaxID=1227549 RepID=A0A1H6SMH6_9RHOB|nr:hypothetical protein [Cribrihabitans marinus]GGH23119.1 hypothetical protein GCM10010973_08840 [Cribrihabitans marinus]SEI69168.1 hypothetical protein SAMN05444007_102141 [Cribrihabitans marinus]
MPNSLAYLMLMLWPVVTLLLFLRLTLERALIWSLLGGYLLLPPVAEFDPPLFPSMNKHSIASVSAFLACLFVARRPVALWSRSWLVRLLLITFLLGAVATVLTNGDPLLFHAIENTEPIRIVRFALPGMGLRDLLSVLIAQLIVLLPFFLGRAFLGTDRGMRELLLGLAIGGLIYSVPALLETVISPVLNIWIYGFFQHDFAQMIRGDGYRPIVFLQHGLWVALFMATALISAAALARRATDKARSAWAMAAVFLGLVVLACKSLASIVLGAVLTPFVLLFGNKAKIRLAVLIAVLAVTYPMLRNNGLIPMDRIIEQSAAISEERAQSLYFRVENEELLLDRAHEKPWFGWGSWGRNLVMDPGGGGILTVPDGNWIIVFGTFGWVGYIAQMGLLAAPILLLGRQMQGMREGEISPHAATVVIILAATLADMLLNDTLINYTWLCAGAVLGHVERLRNPDLQMHRAGHPRFGDGPIIGAQPKRNLRSLL